MTLGGTYPFLDDATGEVFIKGFVGLSGGREVGGIAGVEVGKVGANVLATDLIMNNFSSTFKNCLSELRFVLFRANHLLFLLISHKLLWFDYWLIIR